MQSSAREGFDCGSEGQKPKFSWFPTLPEPRQRGFSPFPEARRRQKPELAPFPEGQERRQLRFSALR